MSVETGVEKLKDFVDGKWQAPLTTEFAPVHNPATGQVIAEVPLGTAADVDRAVQAAHAAFPRWRETPPVKRAQYLFELKHLLEKNADELAHIVTLENGKTLSEAAGSVRRGIECVEVAAGAPSLLMGMAIEDVATGIDCESVRQPLGVFACIAPFNFPAMVPLWFYPFAVACGNTFVCKPSERVPLSQRRMFQLIEEAGFPAGVLNLVNGAKDCVNAIIEHPKVEGVSFVGSSPVAEHVYKTAAAHGKRVQALGGAKNFIVVMPDADMEKSLDAISESAYGCAGERCLAGSVVLAVGDAHDAVRSGLERRARALKVGDGTKDGTDMGPVISAAHRERVTGYIEKGVREGAELVVDGREHAAVSGDGYFLGATLFDNVKTNMVVANDEIFGPVLCISKTATLDDALQTIANHPLANATSIFTSSGKHARDFKYRVHASMTGVNIGVAAPMSFFGFGGAKGSFFGDLKAHGREAFDFFTDKKIVISRWS
ncbi:MAG: CoA-acylating methylmalonate-semialdehyde dehydrogenase [Gemmatimonadetes bacterium]|nr:CoA-acylating methylmalonate-semialdehyde dehydrogenase [Gemmatimonadota bacterium]